MPKQRHNYLLAGQLKPDMHNLKRKPKLVASKDNELAAWCVVGAICLGLLLVVAQEVWK